MSITTQPLTMSADTTTLAAPVAAPEDLRAGDYVTVLRTVHEIPSFLWCSESYQLDPEQPVRYQCIPDDSGTPLKIKAVCLPFVFVERPSGRNETLDVRRNSLARLCQNYARQVVRSKERRRKGKRGR